MSEIRDMIDSLDDGDNLSAETHFKNTITNRVGDAIETKRREVAGSMVTHHVSESEEDEEI